MKAFFLVLALATLPMTAQAVTANQVIASLQQAVAANGDTDVTLSFKVAAAHSAGDAMSSVNSITFVGQTESVYPGSPSVTTAAVVNILLP